MTAGATLVASARRSTLRCREGAAHPIASANAGSQRLSFQARSRFDRIDEARARLAVQSSEACCLTDAPTSRPCRQSGRGIGRLSTPDETERVLGALSWEGASGTLEGRCDQRTTSMGVVLAQAPRLWKPQA